jgi:hypothetical protein
MPIFDEFHDGVLALIHYRLSQATPDFAAFAKNTDAYDQASEAEKPAVLADEVTTLRSTFESIGPEVRLVWRGRVRLARAGHVAGRFALDGLADGLGEDLAGYDGHYRLRVDNLAAYSTLTLAPGEASKVGPRLGRRDGVLAEVELTVAGPGAPRATANSPILLPVRIERLRLLDESGEILARAG